MRNFSKSIFVVIMCLAFFTSNSFAGGTIEIEGSLNLTGSYNEHEVEFFPNDSGHHWVNFTAGYYNAKVQTIVYWASDVNPTWTPFYSDWKSSDCVILYSGTDDVRFKIKFQITYSNPEPPISWKFYKNDGN